ncbi:hypothetical protein TIFTF001_048226 [Ficus carica]|uniref:Uncharacterized protein n=1 Tax=Ficus carica TaxID=3494 RepID=A0AA87ZTI9_FICCA|nr:hypothetical protein TIFTF001_048222 [Ficus carica]GMN32903.1 hypothetical protein TIFTF001_048226 [Ficus carica]
MSRFAVMLGESSSYTRYEQVNGRLHGYSGVLRGVAVEFTTCRVPRVGWRVVEPHVVVGGKTNRSLGIHAARRGWQGGEQAPGILKFELRERLAGSRTDA